MNAVSIIGVALAKTGFQAHGARADGSVAFRPQVPRARRLDCFSAAPQGTVALAACAGAPHWARTSAALGHHVRLMAAIYGKPFVKRQKTDRADAAAIAEAALRPTLRCVAGKSVDKPASAGSAAAPDAQGAARPSGGIRDRRGQRAGS